jgi:trehalose/maltose hydrolase-like predicted phosphorylase
MGAVGAFLDGYDGHVFWDQDTFQAPPLMVFYPEVAKNLLQNRLFQLPAYQTNAEAFGLEGAYVPWEVGFTGGFARDNLVNHEEVHVAGDVALFIKQYYQLTQNNTELHEFFPLLEGIADFVVSRVNRTDEHGWLSIENIVAPDESTGESNR